MPLAIADHARLDIDLNAIAANYHHYRRLVSPASVAACVKADAYGLGAAAVASQLADEGCQTFFTATYQEAKNLPKLGPQTIIYVLNGPADPQAYQDEPSIRPVIGSLDELAAWRAPCQSRTAPPQAALHIDTGMNRHGLDHHDLQQLSKAPELLHGIDLSLVISHLANADDPANPTNSSQRNSFEIARHQLGLENIPASLANSAGAFLGKPYHYDIVRVGIGLYGGNPFSSLANPLLPTIRLSAPITRLRNLDPGTSVGYGANWRAPHPSRIALIPIGYGDGYPRNIAAAGAFVSIPDANAIAPIIGRISMDMTTIDITHIDPRFVARGTQVELIGSSPNLDRVAAWAGTIPYEILTRLANRVQRVHS